MLLHQMLVFISLCFQKMTSQGENKLLRFKILILTAQRNVLVLDMKINKNSSKPALGVDVVANTSIVSLVVFEKDT